MRPTCERCDRDLPPTAQDAWICSFECTWCADCAASVLAGRCPNCGGRLSPRPPRDEERPPSTPVSTGGVVDPDRRP
ncbi:DUF1272 domain-containing protein [Kineococcus gynurae]